MFSFICWTLSKTMQRSMVSGILNVQPIWRALGEEKARALPILHGTDNVGKFSGISKLKWFMRSDADHS